METVPQNTAKPNAMLVGQSLWTRQTREAIVVQAAHRSPLLLRGPKGSGKALIARAVHESSPRASGRFLAVDCASLENAAARAYLFGGAQGNATAEGCLTAAHGGTVYLEEVAALDRQSQAGLFAVLSEGEVLDRGRRQTVDVRLIAATEADLSAEVAAGRFLGDLAARLAVGCIETWPLAERRDDIPVLAAHFLARFAAAAQRPEKRLSPQARAALQGYSWPGNVNELEYVLERAAVLARGAVIGPQDLGLTDDDEVLAFPRAAADRPPMESVAVEPVAVESPAEEAPTEASGPWPTLSDIECAHLRHTLDHVEGDEREAARLLDMDFCQFQQRVMRYGLRARVKRACSTQQSWRTGRKAA